MPYIYRTRIVQNVEQNLGFGTSYVPWFSLNEIRKSGLKSQSLSKFFEFTLIYFPKEQE